MNSVALLQSIINGLVSSGLYILIALGLTLILSIMGIVQMSHGEIYMIGAYCVYYLVAGLGLNFFPALLTAIVLVGCLGIFLERVCFRPFRGDLDRGVIISIGLILVLQNLVLSVAGGDPRSYDSPVSGVLRVFGAAISMERLFIVFTGIVLLIALYLFITRTRTGQAMRAISQDREGAALQGISIDRLSAVAMFLGCGMATVAGALVGALFSVSPTMGTFALMKGIAVIVLGGLGSIPGAVIGGLIIGLIDGIMPAFTTSHMANLIGFAAIILILIFRPQGISGHA